MCCEGIRMPILAQAVVFSESQWQTVGISHCHSHVLQLPWIKQLLASHLQYMECPALCSSKVEILNPCRASANVCIVPMFSSNHMDHGIDCAAQVLDTIFASNA